MTTQFHPLDGLTRISADIHANAVGMLNTKFATLVGTKDGLECFVVDGKAWIVDHNKGVPSVHRCDNSERSRELFAEFKEEKKEG